MIRTFFHSRGQSRPERPAFRPTLESLEGREVPSVASQVSNTLTQLPAQVSNLQSSLAAGKLQTVYTNLQSVTNSLTVLESNAASFVTSDRLRIDTALFANGVALFLDGLEAFALGMESQAGLSNASVGYYSAGFSILGAGYGAAASGMVDAASAVSGSTTGTIFLS
jgi:hypothetical protein